MDPASTFEAQGYLVFDRLFDPGLIDAIREEYERQVGNLTERSMPPHLKVGDRRVQLSIMLQGALLAPALIGHPLLMSIMGSLLGRDYLIDSATCVVSLPGAKDQELHRDHHQLFPGAPESGERLPPYAVTVAVPLVDLTPETGATKMFAGSHRLFAREGQKPDGLGDGKVGYMQKGGCYLMDYRLWHHGTANVSPDPRPILYIVYARYWFADTLNFAALPRLKAAKDELMALPTAHRRLFRRMAAKGAFDLTEAEFSKEL